MRKELPIVIIIIATSLLFLIFISWNKRNTQATMFKIEGQLIEANSNYDLLKRQESLVYKTIGTHIDLITNAKPTLFLRLHEHICFNCYTQALSNLHSYLIPFTNTYEIVILGSFQYQSKLLQILEDYNLDDYNYINTLSISNLCADELNIPYFFTTFKNFKINHILFFDKYSDNSRKVSLFLIMLNNLDN